MNRSQKKISTYSSTNSNKLKSLRKRQPPSAPTIKLITTLAKPQPSTTLLHPPVLSQRLITTTPLRSTQNKLKLRKIKQSYTASTSLFLPSSSSRAPSPSPRPFNAQESYISHNRRLGDFPNCWMIFQRGAKELGYVEYRLYDDVAVNATSNFRLLCLGATEDSYGVLGYLGSNIFGIYPGNFICGGDIDVGRGHTGTSAWNMLLRADIAARYYFRHDRAGLLSTVGPDHEVSGDDLGYDETDPMLINSKYQISLDECPWLNSWSEVFGEVVKGMNIVYEIANTPVDARDFPLQPVFVKACGVCNW